MSDPATAPDLVEVIQAALAAHQRLTLALYPDYYCCTCGERSIDQPSAHQARAVLAALTEAGTVEWGVRRVGQAEVNLVARNEKNAHNLLLGDEEVVSRLTLPWERAE